MSGLDIVGIIAAMQIKFTLTAEEYVEAQLYWKRRLERRWIRRSSDLKVWAAAFILIVCGVLLLRGTVWFIGTFCVFLGLFLVAWRGSESFRLRREFRRSRMLQREISMDIHEEGLWTASSYSEGKTTWEAFSRYLETPHLFLLDIPPNLFCIIPKKA